jgi:hypothetical protein
LSAEWSLFEHQWHTTRRDWRDAVAERFENEFWKQWEAEFAPLLRELNELEDSMDLALRSLS